MCLCQRMKVCQQWPNVSVSAKRSRPLLKTMCCLLTGFAGVAFQCIAATTATAGGGCATIDLCVEHYACSPVASLDCAWQSI